MNALLLAVLWPWFVWLGGWRRDTVIIAVSFGAAAFAVCATYVTDGDLRRTVPLGRLLVGPVVVGAWLLPLPLTAGILAAVGAGVASLTSRRLAKEFVATLMIAVTGAAVIAVVIDRSELVERDRVARWLALVGTCLVVDGLAAIVDALVRPVRHRERRLPTVAEVLAGALAVLVQCAAAIVLIELAAARSLAAVPAFIATVGAFVMARHGLATSVRSTRLARLNRFAMRLATLVSDVEVYRALLGELVEATDSRKAWLLVVRSTSSTRYDCTDGNLLESQITELDYQLSRSVADGTCVLFDALDPTLPMSFRRSLAANGYAELIVTALGGPKSSRLVLIVADRGDDYGRFDRDDVHLVEAIATHGRLAMMNVDLFDQVRQKAAEQEYLATHDQLTGLPNRTMIHGALRVAIENDRPTAVLLLGLDRFREINDTLGHTYGDLVLLEVARRLTRLLDYDEFVARLGGDEWAIVCQPPEGTDPRRIGAVATALAHRILQSLGRPFSIDELAIDIRGSIGIAIAGPDAPDPVTLLRHADVAMYLAKRTRSRIEIYRHDRDHHSPRRLALAGRLRAAIERDDLHLQYQPQIRLATNSIWGAEALIRWRLPDGTIVRPDEFVAVAERTGLIHDLTHLVIRHAVEFAARTYADGHPLRVSINLSAHSITDPTIVRFIADALEHHRVPPHLLLVELTESAVMEDESRGIEMMRRLRELGLGIAIDDFGTGQSSLSYLTKLPATELKIDQSFVRPLTTDPAAAIVVRSTISLAHSLGMGVVAEGVETIDQRNALREMGCDIGQGYLFSPPLEARGLELWLEDWCSQSAPTAPMQPRAMQTRAMQTRAVQPRTSSGLAPGPRQQ